MSKYIGLIFLLLTVGLGQSHIKHAYKSGHLPPPIPIQRDAKIDERLEMMKIWRMTEYLELSAEQAEQFFPLLKEHDRTIKDILDNKLDLEKSFRKKLENDESLTEGELNDFLDQLFEFDQAVQLERQEYLLRFKDVLNTKQIGKLALFGHVFRDEIREHMRLPPRRMGKH
jgi:hypothetical protein